MDVFPNVKTDPRYENKLVEIHGTADIPRNWRGTPVEQFILSQNFGHPIAPCQTPQVLISTCIEFRYAMPVPSMYAYVIRRAGGRLVGSEFTIAYVLSRGVRHVILIGHNDCGMAKVGTVLADLVEAIVDQGWDRKRAEEFIHKYAPRYSVANELDALEQEFHRLRRIFKKLEVAPLFTSLFDKRLYVPRWYQDLVESGLHRCVAPVADEELIQLI